MKKNILVTGGAGYIGSHFVKEVLKEHKEEYNIIIIDNLSKGDKKFIPTEAEFFESDIENKKILEEIFKKDIYAVIHFAAYIEAGESMKNPQKYFLNNTKKTIILLQEMLKFGCKKFILSSTAAVYGEPNYTPIDEDHPTKPTNYYGLSKLMIEEVLESYNKAYDLKSIRLRYFNAAGADLEGELGENHDPETHLIPIIIQAAQGKRDKLFIFGNDYKTRDGTCIRDYIHVKDLARAHILALKRLEKTKVSEAFNLGSEKGFTVKEIIKTVEDTSGKKINQEVSSRREGDPAILIASSKKAKKELGWKTEYSDIKTIISSAYKWHEKNENMHDN